MHKRWNDEEEQQEFSLQERKSHRMSLKLMVGFRYKSHLTDCTDIKH